MVIISTRSAAPAHVDGGVIAGDLRVVGPHSAAALAQPVQGAPIHIHLGLDPAASVGTQL